MTSSTIKFFDKYKEYHENLQKEDEIFLVKHQFALLRSLIQTSAIASIYVIHEINPDLLIEYKIYELIDRLQMPSESLPIEILDKTILIIRNNLLKYRKISNGWYEDDALNKRLHNWVTIRNSFDHGAPSEEELRTPITSLIDDSLSILQELTPVLINNILYVELDRLYRIDINLFPSNNLCVLRHLKHKKTNLIGLLEIIDFDKRDKYEVTIPKDSILNAHSYHKLTPYNYTPLQPYKNGKEVWVFENIPNRITDNFVGRKVETNEIIDWFNDDEENSCLIYGDGGYGKTTLILEFLNQLKESSIDITTNRMPDIICFYSAKQTRWYNGELINLKGQTSILKDALEELLRFILEEIDKKWYQINNIDEAIKRCIALLKENKLERNHVLLIIDNTETLIEKQEDGSELSQAFKKISKQIGRLIVTSRRNETISGSRIHVNGLTEDDSLLLIEKLLSKYDNKKVQSSAIGQMGLKGKKDLAKKVSYKPILIEYIVHHLIVTQSDVNTAVRSIYGKSNIELLQFLYDDAYKRIQNEAKEVFMIMSSLFGLVPINHNTLPYICENCDISISNFLEILNETYFAKIEDYGEQYSVELVELAKQFFLNMMEFLNNQDKTKLRQITLETKKFYEKDIKLLNMYRNDRVHIAFRNKYARMAKNCFENCDYDNAERYYEKAISDDFENSYLYDRYAFCLIKKQNLQKALDMSTKAIGLNDKNHDFLVTYALIQYRLGNFSEGDKFINKAEACGRSKSYCYLQKGIARYYSAKLKWKNHEDIKNIYSEIRLAQDFLETSKIEAEKENTGYAKKNLTNYYLYSMRIANLKKDIDSNYLYQQKK